MLQKMQGLWTIWAENRRVNAFIEDVGRVRKKANRIGLDLIEETETWRLIDQHSGVVLTQGMIWSLDDIKAFLSVYKG